LAKAHITKIILGVDHANSIYPENIIHDQSIRQQFCVEYHTAIRQSTNNMLNNELYWIWCTWDKRIIITYTKPGISH
jgi:hypothetical protein